MFWIITKSLWFLSYFNIHSHVTRMQYAGACYLDGGLLYNMFIFSCIYSLQWYMSRQPQGPVLKVMTVSMFLSLCQPLATVGKILLPSVWSTHLDLESNKVVDKPWKLESSPSLERVDQVVINQRGTGFWCCCKESYTGLSKKPISSF